MEWWFIEIGEFFVQLRPDVSLQLPRIILSSQKPLWLHLHMLSLGSILMTQLTLVDSPATAVAKAPKRLQSRRSGGRPGLNPKADSTQDVAKNPARTFREGPSQVAFKEQQSVAHSASDVGNRPLPKNSQHPVSLSSATPNSAEMQHPDGVQQIGDLARLVLMRYELAAKQREAMVQRRRKK